MSKRCELQNEYYKANGNYKGSGKYSDDYVIWLENEVLALRAKLNIANLSGEYCPICKSDDLVDVDDHYTKCCKCGFSFVG